MEGIPLAFVTESFPMLELYVRGNLECTYERKSEREKTSFIKFILGDREIQTYSRVEKFHGTLLSDLAQVWQRPDRLIWKFWSGAGLALVSIPRQNSLYVAKTIFFSSFEKFIG